MTEKEFCQALPLLRQAIERIEIDLADGLRPNEDSVRDLDLWYINRIIEDLADVKMQYRRKG